MHMVPPLSPPSSQTLDDLVESWAKAIPDHPAILAPGRPILTHQQLYQQISTLKEKFQALGLASSARLALVAPSGPELALAFLGSATYAISAPLNPAYTKDELAFYLDDLEASALLIASDHSSPARELAHSRGIPILELYSHAEDPAGCFSIDCETHQVSPYSNLTLPDPISLILHTSGTTAKPKQVPLSQGNLCTSLQNLQRSLQLTPSDRCLNLMPLFHIHGIVGGLLASLGSGGSVACTPSFSQTEVLKWMQELHPTWITAVPTIHQALLAQVALESKPLKFDSLRFIRSSSASLAPTVMADLEKIFGVPVIEAYGMTEAAHQMASNPLPPEVRKPGSVGLPAGPEIRVVSETGEVVPPGKNGEVAIKGPNVMKGYSQNPEANAKAFQHEWFLTGDQGYLDKDGYLFLTGRLKEQINRGGEKIAPLEIDQVLLQHSDIHQAVTFGIPHPTLGEEVAAAVVTRNSTTVTEAELRAWFFKRLAPYKVPKKVFFLQDIPKGPTGKIQRRLLAEQLMSPSRPPSKETAQQIEEYLLELYQRFLKVDRITLDDNFFVLGGDSIGATQIANQIQSQFSTLPIDAVTIFEHPTVAELHQFFMKKLDPQSLKEFGRNPTP